MPVRFANLSRVAALHRDPRMSLRVFSRSSMVGTSCTGALEKRDSCPNGCWDLLEHVGVPFEI